MKQKNIGKATLGLWYEFLFEAFTCIYIVAVVALCWRRPLWSSVLLCVGLALQLWFWRKKADAAMMAAAALLGTPSEILCVKLGVWTYHAPGLVFEIPVWIPLVWAFLFCLFRRISLSIYSATLRVWPNRKSFARKILFAVLGGVIVVYYIATVSVIMRTIATVYTVFMIPAAIFWHRERDIYIFFVGGILGTLGEYICIELGFWDYHYPAFRSIGLPVSLPLAWGLSSVIIGRIACIWETNEEV